MRAWIVGALLVGLAGGLEAQSLGDAAAREKKRREAIDKEKKEAPKVFTDEDLERYSGGPPLDGAGRPEARANASPSPEPPEGDDWAAPRRRIAETLKPALRDCEASLDSAKQRLKDAEAHWAFVDRYPFNGFSLDQARTRLDNARKAVARARETCDAIEEQARRAGVPPGWIR
jgi:hypothetical protein